MTQFYFIILMMPAVKAEVENRLSGMETEKHNKKDLLSAPKVLGSYALRASIYL